MNCPPALLLEGADRIVLRTPGREREGAAVQYIAALEGLDTACRRDGDRLVMDVRFNVLAEAGLAFDGDPISLDVFLASVARGQIRARRRIDVLLEIDAPGGRDGQREQITLRFPEPSGDERFYIGFELDQDLMRAQIEQIP